MKKILSIFLAAVMLFSVLTVAGCKEKTGTDESLATGEADITEAYYEDGKLYIPIDMGKMYKIYIVKNDKYTWIVRYSVGIQGLNTENFDELARITVECNNCIAVIPEEYANEKYFIQTSCHSVPVVILVTQNPNPGTTE